MNSASTGKPTAAPRVACTPTTMPGWWTRTAASNCRSAAKACWSCAAISSGDGEWVRTTDLATLDEDRFLWISGRTDNAINRGGFKVHGEEIGRILERHPDVREVCVVGIADKRLGAVPAAAVVPRQGVGLSAGRPARLGAGEHAALPGSRGV